MEGVHIFRAHQSQLEELPSRAGSLNESRPPLDDGIYTVFRIYPERKVLRFHEHVARLAHSAELLDMPFLLTESWLRTTIYRAIDKVGLDSLRARIMVPGRFPDTLIIALEPFRPISEEIYLSGVRVGLATIQRNHPTAKDTRFIEFRQNLRKQQPEVFEILIQKSTGEILEGMSSNFYAVLHGKLHTAGENVLPGITRSVLLQIAPRVWKVAFDPIHVNDLASVEEAFLTSASRGVLSVVQIADQVIGSGNPGLRTMQIRRHFRAQVQAELEPILPDNRRSI
jgi:branched-chain amino acid aminotransferase